MGNFTVKRQLFGVIRPHFLKENNQAITMDSEYYRTMLQTFMTMENKE
jgi:hypothetical protein